jgi:hypothetical protein
MELGRRKVTVRSGRYTCEIDRESGEQKEGC